MTPKGPKRRPGGRSQADEMLSQVEEWDEDLRVFVRWQLETSAKDSTHFVPLALLYLMEQTVEALLDQSFRERYSALLAESDRAATGHFMASHPERGRKLIQQLGVVEVIPPSTRERGEGEFPVHAFPRPVIHHRSRTGRKTGQVEPENIRLLLDHIHFLGWHPQYLLTCTRCGWPQGALATAEAYHSDVPDPGAQVAEWWSHLQRGSFDESMRWTLERLVDSFCEEVWGNDVIATPAQRRTPLTRRPCSGEIAKVLDEAFGVSTIPESWPHKEELAKSRAQRLDLVAKILAPLKCQICAETGRLRYMPRLLLPIDADLTAQSQAEFLGSLAKIFDTARKAIAANKPLGDVLWIPMAFPRLREAELAERFELRHELRVARSPRWEPNWWLVAMWLVDVASASRTKGRRRATAARRGRRRRAQWTWRAIHDELGIPSLQGTSLTDMEEEDRQISELQAAIGHLIGVRNNPPTIPRIRALLTDERYSAGALKLASLYAERVLPQKLADLRRKA